MRKWLPGKPCHTICTSPSQLFTHSLTPNATMADERFDGMFLTIAQQSQVPVYHDVLFLCFVDAHALTRSLAVGYRASAG